MRRVETHPKGKAPKLERSPERDSRLRSWLQTELTSAFSARFRLEAVFREARRQYEGVPRIPVRTSPIPNAPNIEITVGAVATDSIYAAAIDLIYTANPLLIARPLDKRWTDHAKAAQRYVNWSADNEVEMRRAVDNAFLDNCQLGTAGYYIPFIENIRKTDIQKVVQRRPIMLPIAPENLIVPHTAGGNIQEERWVGLRFYYTETEVQDRARNNPAWDISKTMPTSHVDWVTEQRHQAGHVTVSGIVRKVFEFIDVYCYFDYDGDGEDEDLLVTWDRSSNSIVAVGFNPYDRRPIEAMRYQPRAHLFYGIGVMEMLQPFQEEATELHNYKVLNALLANCRMYVATQTSGITESMEVWPNKVVVVQGDIDSFKELRMSDVFPQLSAFEESAMRLAEQRCGLRGELSMLARGGSRTPATTALSLLQQTNRRFTPAFDGMRLATAAALRQTLWRWSERVKAGDKKAREHFARVLGDADGALMVSLLEEKDFEEAVSVEFTAASATVSREADRQNAILLTNAMDNQHQQVITLLQLAQDPNTMPPVRAAALKIIAAKNEMFDRTMRLFDHVRDPETFIADVRPELEAINEQAQAENAMLGAVVAGMLPAPMAPPAGIPGVGEVPPGGAI